MDLGERQKIHHTEEEYREAYLLWKKEHGKAKYVSRSTIVILPNQKEIPLGNRINIMKSIYKAMQEGKHYGSNKDLTDEQIDWWRSQGVDLGERQKIHHTEEEYREAYLLWKKKNRKVKKVPFELVVELPNGKMIGLGKRIARMKLIATAMEKGEHYENYKDLTEEQIDWWTKNGVPLPKKPKLNKYQEAYLLWKKENPNMQEIPKKLVICLPNGKKVSLGNRILMMRCIYGEMQKGEHYGNYKDLTSDEILWWRSQGVDLGERQKIHHTEEEYREAYLLWEKENRIVSAITSKTVVELSNGRKIPLGNRMNTMKFIYDAMQQGKHYGKSKDLTKEQIAWWKSHGFSFEKKKQSTKKNQTSKTIGDLLLEFHMDLNELIRSLERAKTKQKQKTDEKSFEEIENQTFRSFCIKEGYQYPVASKAVKLHSFLKEESLEQLINRVLLEKENKQVISSWIFEIYGSMMKEVLEKLNLNVEQVLRDMSKRVIPIEEAICHSIFQTTCKQEECDYLEDFYEDMIVQIDFQSKEEEIAEKVVRKIMRLGKKEHLTSEEIGVLKSCLFHYLETIREYQVIDVGLELDENKKLEKIRNYNLTEEEIEESYFAPFYFEEGILLGEKSELYRRRELLRQYIIDWDYYTEEEKEVVKEEQHFTEEEILLMETMRREINETIKESQKVKNK